MRGLLLIAFVSAARAADYAFPAVPPPSVKIEAPQVVPNVTVRTPKIKPFYQFGRMLPDAHFDAVSIDGLIDLYGSVENLRAALAAERLELIELSSDASRSGDRGARSVAISDADSATLRYLLTSDATFDWAIDYDCAPDYRYRVKLHHGALVISVDLCFSCRTLRVLRDGREIAAKNFDFGYDSLCEVLSRYFPALLEKRANQALEPTTLLVMPRACARVTPSRVVAHL